jgi:hypothetical protein
MTPTSVHYRTERQGRHTFIQEYIGEGNVIDSFVVDRGHPSGAEIHSVTDTGIIIIHNQRTNKIITELIARPEQLRKLYRLENRKVPKGLLSLAYKHNIASYNKA